MKHISKALILLFSIGILVSASPFALASRDVVEPTDDFYVADYANVLSEETENYIVSQNEALYSACGGQFCVVTIDFLNELDAEQYSYALSNQWEIGDGEKNNGSLLLMVVGEEKYWLCAGSGIENDLDAGTLNTILYQSFESDFLSGNYDDAAKNTTDAVMSWYDNYYGISNPNTYQSDSIYTPEVYYGNQEPVQDDDYGGVSLFKVVIVLAAIVFILSKLPGGSRRRGGGSFFFLPLIFRGSGTGTSHRSSTGGFRSSSGFRGSSGFGGGGSFRSGGSSFRGGGGGGFRGGGAGRK